MKIKVKGLVFVGFAATVFASSAMAEPAISGQSAKNTVTSKYYVEHNFQKINKKVKTREAADANSGALWTSEEDYPSMKVLKSVKDEVTAIDVNDGNNGYVTVSESVQNPGTFTVGVANTPATTAAGITGTTATGDSTTLVTAAAVKNALDTGITATSTETDATIPTSLAVQTYVNGYAQDKSKIDAATGDGTNTAYSTTISSLSANDTYPTSQNVYQFVTNTVGGAAYQPKLENSQTGLYLGSYSGGASTWQELQGSSNGTSATTGYVTIQADDGVYKVNLDAAQVASSIASGSSTKLATEGAVYNYVGTNFQPIAATDNNIKIGYNGDWQNLGGDGTYVTVSSSNGASSVALTNITAAGTGATSDFTTNNTKLARAGDVYDFVMAQLGGTAIPQAPSVCENAANGVWCALVYGQIGGTSADPTYGLKWTIMAPDDGVTAENEPFGA